MRFYFKIVGLSSQHLKKNDKFKSVILIRISFQVLISSNFPSSFFGRDDGDLYTTEVMIP